MPAFYENRNVVIVLQLDMYISSHQIKSEWNSFTSDVSTSLSEALPLASLLQINDNSGSEWMQPEQSLSCIFTAIRQLCEQFDKMRQRPMCVWVSAYDWPHCGIRPMGKGVCLITKQTGIRVTWQTGSWSLLHFTEHSSIFPFASEWVRKNIVLLLCSFSLLLLTCFFENIIRCYVIYTRKSLSV